MLKKITKRIIDNNAPRWFVLVVDLYLIINTFILAYFIRFNFQLTFDTSKLLLQLPVLTLVFLSSFLLVGSYKGIIRHTGVRDSINVSLASVISFVVLGTLVFVNRKYQIAPSFTIPISILVIHFLLNEVVLIASRYLFKEAYNRLVSDVQKNRCVLIYGTGDAGLITYSVLKDNRENKMHVIGFVDDNKQKIGSKINGLKVYDSNSIDEEFIKKKKVSEIIITVQKRRPIQLIETVSRFSTLAVAVKIVPPVKSWIDSNLKAHHIKPVKIEDLLGREPIALNNPILQKEFHRKVIFVTGAAGSIGSEIARQVATFGYQHLVLIDQAESALYDLQQYFKSNKRTNITSIVADVRNKKRMAVIFDQYRPDIVFHAAAYKHVPFMEENPFEAICVNVFGTQIIADLSLEYRVKKFVMVSTDKAVNPTNVMGATKRVAEMYINSLRHSGETKFITTRFGNVLGSNGSVIPLFQSQIKNGGPLTVTHKDITRYFMTIPEACQLVLEAGAMGKGGEIFVFDMGESIKIFDLAIKMIQLSGLRYPDDIDIEITGLRPGEKIYEELLGSEENALPTYHDKIMIAKVKSVEAVTLHQKMEALYEYNQQLDVKQTILKMKEIVPEFISNNSEYEQLDKIPLSEDSLKESELRKKPAKVALDKK